MTMRWLVQAALLVATTATLGCVTQFGPGEVAGTKLGQGEEVITGNSNYDEFFSSARNLLSRTDSMRSPELHRPVAGMLGVKDKGDEQGTLTAAKEKASALKEGGNAIYVVLAPEPKLVSKLETKDKDVPALLLGIENALRESLSRARQFEATSREIDQLEATRLSLEGETGASFSEPEKKAEVDRELEAARVLLEAAKLRVDAETGRALRFAVGLAGAFDTGSAEKLATADAPPAAAPKKPGPVRSGGPGPRPGGGPAPAKPAKPKKPADDFEP